MLPVTWKRLARKIGLSHAKKRMAVMRLTDLISLTILAINRISVNSSSPGSPHDGDLVGPRHVERLARLFVEHVLLDRAVMQQQDAPFELDALRHGLSSSCACSSTARSRSW